LRETLPSWRRSLLGAALVAAFSWFSAAPDDALASERLTKTLVRERFTSGRLASQHAWQPCIAVDTAALVPDMRCSGSPRPGTRLFKRIDAAGRATRQLRSASSPAAIRAGALLDLRWLDVTPAGVDRAVESLERARRAAPDDVAVLNDLAVAYLELGERDQQLMPMLRALDAIERAASRDSAHLAVRFNRALILQRLYLIQNAERAWARYLAMERDPRWRAEARTHAQHIHKAVDTLSWEPLLDHPPRAVDPGRRADIGRRVRQAPQAAREFCFKKLLPAWGVAVEAGDDVRAANILGLVGELATAADSMGADRSVSLALRAIRATADDPDLTRSLGRAHVRLSAGLELYSSAAYDSAAVVLGQVEDALRALGSPAARWTAFHRAAAEVNRGRSTFADTLLWNLLDEITPEEPSLRGKTVWALGVSQLRRGNLQAANRLYREAGPYFVKAREPDNQGAVSYLLAEGLSLAGQPLTGQAEAFRGLRLLSPFRRYIFLNNHLTTVATYARAERLSHASLSVMNEVLDVAHAAERPQFIAWAIRARAHDLVALGRPDAARRELAEALRWADRIKPGSGRDRLQADVTLAVGQITRLENPRAAYRLLSGVVTAYRKLEGDTNLSNALYEAALAAQAVGDTVGARALLDEAIGEIERQQQSFSTTESRAAFYETVENVFDAIISGELDRGSPASAFRYLERGRIALRAGDERGHSSHPADARPADIRQIGARIPADMLFVEYAVLGDRIAIWTASRRGWEQYSVALPRDSVSALVERFMRELHEPPAGAGARSELFDRLMRPLAGALNGFSRLTIVADRGLYRLPFAALWDRRTGRYLVEDFEVRTVPSATFLVEAMAIPHVRSGDSPALVVGNPQADTLLVQPLEPLPGAANEAARVADLYRRAQLLTGADADRVSVVELLPGSSIFHFAGHAVFNAAQPELSYLALAPVSQGGTGLLHAWEIGQMRLSNLQVVILSACSTLGPRPSRSGVTAGLAYSFLRAGVPATISTLWDVGDEASEELLVDFHRRFAAGATPAEALRLAQLSALRSSHSHRRAPNAWAAFTYTGP
jgi:CHAT domain-containing protein